MEARATLRYARIAPRKVKIVCDLIRGKDAKTAEAILRATPRRLGAAFEAAQERLRQRGKQL
jgi:ribosomal protein L22